MLYFKPTITVITGTRFVWMLSDILVASHLDIKGSLSHYWSSQVNFGWDLYYLWWIGMYFGILKILPDYKVVHQHLNCMLVELNTWEILGMETFFVVEILEHFCWTLSTHHQGGTFMVIPSLQDLCPLWYFKCKSLLLIEWLFYPYLVKFNMRGGHSMIWTKEHVDSLSYTLLFAIIPW